MIFKVVYVVWAEIVGNRYDNKELLEGVNQ